MKKISSFFMGCLIIISSVFFSSNAYAAKEFSACIAVFCDNTEVAQSYIEKLYGYEYNDGTRQLIKLSKVNNNKTVVVHSNYGSMKYNIYFNVINSNLVLNPSRELGSFLKNCTGALIIYDIADEKLTPIVKSNTYYKEDVSSFIKMDNTLNNCIRYLESFGRNGWYNALNFITYNKEKLNPEVYAERREQLNRYTLGVEALYMDGDNKWGRGHPDISIDRGIKSPIVWSAGHVYRSIFMDRVLRGNFSGLDFKKRISHLNSVPTQLPQGTSQQDLIQKQLADWVANKKMEVRQEVMRMKEEGIPEKDIVAFIDNKVQETQSLIEELSPRKKWRSKILILLAGVAGIAGLAGAYKWLKAKFCK